MNCTLREWQKKTLNLNDIIFNASMMDGSDSWTPFPIGVSHHMFTFLQANKGFLKTEHKRLFHTSILIHTDQDRRKNTLNRKKINDILQKKGILNYQYTPANFFKSISNSKYVISPEGHGIDCHRTYEALLAGCIPIVEDNPLTREKYAGLPILFTKDYSDLDQRSLERRWEAMLDTKYDFSKLFISSYSSEIQQQIKNNGNYWLKRLGACITDYYN
jgi:hypothetical protein